MEKEKIKEKYIWLNHTNSKSIESIKKIGIFERCKENMKQK